MFKKVPYQKKKNFIKKLKMPYHKTYKIPYQKTSSRILKKRLIMSKKDTLSKKKKLIKNLKQVLYQRTFKRV